MPPVRHILCILLTGLALISCGKKEYREAGGGHIHFSDPDISIDVGPDWLRIDAVPKDLCSPSLVGKAGILQTYWARAEFPDAEAVIAETKKRNPDSSFEEKEFRSTAGLQGKFCSFLRSPAKSNGQEIRISKIIVPTRSGRLLILDLIGPSGSIHETARGAIVQTLANGQQ
jgi:hypothetical protein